MSGNMIGRILNGRYKITDRIGIGGMAEVFRAQDMTFNRTVAVKVMLPQYASNPTFAQRFRQEAAAAANLQSPYIVNVYDWGKDKETYYIVMEYVRGSDLKSAIKERGAINQRKVAEIGTQVCMALSSAHRLDIIHRDIKPQNIMIQPDGNIKVMDFGIAHAKNSVLTQTSSVLGTAHYVSPEQAQGKPLSATSDIYSLGIVLYEAACGRLPFDGPDAVSVAMKQVSENPLPCREINPDLDPALEAIILKALAKDPSMRFQTARDMKHALNDYLQGRVGFAGAETQVIPGATHPTGFYPSGATEIMPAINNPANEAPSANKYVATDGPTPKKSKTPLIVGILLAAVAIAGIAWGVFNFLNSQGDMALVPELKNLEQAQAQQAIERAGFTVGSITIVKSNEVEQGKVVSQDPAGNTRAKKGSRINLNISGGEDQVIVPDLSNLTADEANRVLARAGLQAQAGNGDYSDSVDTNRVMKQTPEAGQRVAKGTTVTYTISLGKQSLAVPSVNGMSQSNAVKKLQAAGFTVDFNYENSDSVPADQVIRYNPTGMANKGSTVTITVSKGPKEKPKPEPKPTPDAGTGDGQPPTQS